MRQDGGKLLLSISWDGESVRNVDIDSTRPQAFRLLHGQTPEKAVQMARLLFNICGNAQGAAAAAAVAAAQGRALPDRLVLERSIACETMQEHLWRLLLDWPRLLGLPPQQPDFVRWHGLLRGVAEGQGDMTAVREELETRWLGCSADQWEMRNLEALHEWWRMTDSPAARLLTALDTMDDLAVPDPGIALLANWTAEQAMAECGDVLDASFAAQPNLRGIAAETGALGYFAQVPLVQDVMRKRPSRLLARVMARVLDVLHIVTEGYHGRLDSVRMPDGAGLAVVRTARGMLLHRVRLEAERVKDYLTVAPTEWNFHPRGVLATGLLGLPVDNRDRLVQLAGLHVLSLDPCVEYSIEINGSAA
jgi:hypothetical protein